MPKRAYLTIDDAPSPDFRRKVQYLVSAAIPAMFFCRGDFLELNEPDALYALSKGFLIGNHSYSHPFFSELSVAAALAEIDRTDRIIERLYRRAGFRKLPRYFRFPHGDKGDFRRGWLAEPVSEDGRNRARLIQGHLRHLGYSYPPAVRVQWPYYNFTLGDVDWFWTFDVQEYRIKTAPDEVPDLEAVINRIRTNDTAQGLGVMNADVDEIILIHDHVETAHLFRAIVAELRVHIPEFLLPGDEEFMSRAA